MNFKPLNDNLLVKQDQAEESTPSGLILTPVSKEKPRSGIVLAAGPGKLKKDHTRAPMDVSKGDRILFAQYEYSTIEIAGESFLVMSEDAVLGKLTE